MNTEYNTVGRLLGGRFKFESKNYPGEFWRHKNFEVWKEKQESSNLYQLDTSFDVVPGLHGIGLSFRSVKYPDHFIRHYIGGECVISKPDEGGDNKLFKREVSWIPCEGIANSKGVSFESVNCPGEYLRHCGGRLRINRNDGSNLFCEDATWYPRMLKSPNITGEWKLIFANDNTAASGQYTHLIEVGTEIIESRAADIWNCSLRGSIGSEGLIPVGDVLSHSLKALFDSSMRSSCDIDASAWRVSERKKEAYTINLKIGEPVYLWQWIITAIASDSTYIMVKTNIYKESKSRIVPHHKIDFE